MKNKIIWILMFILLISSVIAQPPSFQTSTATNLDIVFPQFSYFAVNQDFTFHIHVYNESGILMTNSTTDCYFHLYNLSGNHLIEEQMLFDSNGVDFYIDIGGNNFSYVGEYTMIAWCNNTDGQGGFTSGEAIATKNGTNPNSPAFLSTTILLIAFMLILIIISKVLDEKHWVLRMFLITSALYTLLILLNLGLNVSEGTAVYSTMLIAFGFAQRIIYLTLTYIILYMGWLAVNMLKNLNKK